MGAVTAVGALMIGLPMCAAPASRQGSSNDPAVSTPEEAAAHAAIAAMPVGHVVSRGVNGAARFVVGAADATAPALGVSAEKAARMHLARNGAVLGLPEAALLNASVANTHAMQGGGSVVQFKQFVGGLPVFRGKASVVLDAQKHLVSIASSLHPAAEGTTARLGGRLGTFRITPEAALAGVYASHSATALPDGAIKDLGPTSEEWRRYRLATAPGATRLVEAAVRKVLFPEGDRLVPAYDVAVIARKPGSTENDGHRYVLAAENGRVLYHQGLTAHEAFTYNVWADPAGNHIPTDGPLADYTPHPSGVPDQKIPAPAAQILVTMDSFNKTKDPWLPATAKNTTGNNVIAYTDRDDFGQAGNPDGGPDGDGLDSADIQATLTDPAKRIFGHVYDLSKQPNASESQKMAAITQIFYVTNWLHDFWYDSGFDEKSGNAQASNLMRGGEEGDPLLAEAQDGADHGQTSNANMSQTPDGISPRMQMYVWDGPVMSTLTATPTIPFSDRTGGAGFGPQTFDVASTPAALVNDGTAPETDACTAVADLTGKIAVIDRGTCALVDKVKAAQAAKAVGVVMINNAPGHLRFGAGTDPDPAATIPVVTVSQEDGALLKAKLAAGAVSLRLTRTPSIYNDGTIDNSVVAHEWGHYLHNRLEEAGGQQGGAMSEGWGDFNALMMVVREGDKVLGSAYPITQYAGQGLNDSTGYFGIRRMPYSTDMTKNSLTFDNVRDASKLAATAPTFGTGGKNSEVHNAGEVWAETLFEGYANMIEAGKTASPPRAFDATKRQMADYVVAGMKATPTDASFTEQRDALLSVVWAGGNKDDFKALATAFAKRGLGVGAVSPPAASTTFNEAVANFDYKAAIGVGDVAIEDKTRSCDNDGLLDSGESGTIKLTVRNTGWLPMSKTKVTVTTTSPNLTFDNKGAVDVPALEPFATATVSVGVTASGVSSKTVVPIAFNVSDADAVTPSVDLPYALLVSADDKPASSATDDVESDKPVWTFAHGDEDKKGWGRAGDATNHVWHGVDVGSPADESLVSPSLTVSATESLTIAFSHAFKFEEGDDPTAPNTGKVAYYDGGVIEISPDDGKTWEDISKYADPGYPHTIFSIPGQPSTNALAGRKAFTGALEGFPALKDVKLDLGTKLAGKTIKVRFRIGTDDASGTEGWNIDNLKFGGITTTPFSSVVDDAKACGIDVPDGGTGNGAEPGDDGCSCSTTVGHATPGVAGGLGLLGSIMALFARRRRSRA